MNIFAIRRPFIPTSSYSLSLALRVKGSVRINASSHLVEVSKSLQLDLNQFGVVAFCKNEDANMLLILHNYPDLSTGLVSQEIL
mmetsp:Transcript_21962/g.47694  ORF Transcript_21962/g.47694 Transcript_21962/m.47694 type:complete len:84 (+) Transcript_21962:1744-1995(+)